MIKHLKSSSVVKTPTQPQLNLRHGKSSNSSVDTFLPQLKLPQNNISKFPENSKNCNRNHILYAKNFLNIQLLIR